MLKTTDFLREFPINWKTDRDCEVPLLLDFIKRIAPINSLLDVGAHWSGKEDRYGALIRPYITKYNGVDIIDDPETRQLLNLYTVGNALSVDLEPCDVVICVSVIEHAGVSTYKTEDIKTEQNRLFRRCLELAKKHLWVSFPVGQQYVYPDELSIITEDQLSSWEEQVKPYKITQRFVYNQGPQASHPWYEHNKRDVALKVPYIDYIGNQSICVMEVEK